MMDVADDRDLGAEFLLALEANVANLFHGNKGLIKQLALLDVGPEVPCCRF